MKKAIAMLLAMMLPVSICGCTQQSVEKEETLLAGYSLVVITPEMSVPLAGYGNTSKRMSQNVLDDLCATCLALTDSQGNTVLLITLDLQGAWKEVLNVGRRAVSNATGVPEEQIVFSASHTHSGPDLTSNLDCIDRYLTTLSQKLVQVAKEAMEDRKEAKLFTGSVETERMNFVKHYTYVDENGQTQYFGDNFGNKVINDTTAHATQVDETMHVVQLKREGSEDIVIANWRAHPGLTGGNKKYDISADYVGSFRSAIESKLGCKFMYIQGAAGNINATTRISSETRTRDYKEYGKILAAYAEKCLQENMKQIKNGLIQTSQTKLAATVDHSYDYLYSAAEKVKKVWNDTNDFNAAVAAAEGAPIRSPYHANAVISRMFMGATITLELNAIVIGDALAFVTAPDELFDSNSAWLEENSPYETTLTVGYANGHQGYIPSQAGYDYTCYESDVSKFVPGTGEQVQQTFLDMLNQLAKKN